MPSRNANFQLPARRPPPSAPTASTCHSSSGSTIVPRRHGSLDSNRRGLSSSSIGADQPLPVRHPQVLQQAITREGTRRWLAYLLDLHVDRAARSSSAPGTISRTASVCSRVVVTGGLLAWFGFGVRGSWFRRCGRWRFFLNLTLTSEPSYSINLSQLQHRLVHSVRPIAVLRAPSILRSSTNFRLL